MATDAAKLGSSRYEAVRKLSARYFAEIGTALAGRGTLADDFERDPEFRECRYVVRMCERIAEKIGQPSVTVREVLRVERGASGHVDYQRKFALYCAELEADVENNIKGMDTKK